MASYNLDYIISAVDKFTPAFSRINNQIKDTQGKLSTFTSSMNKWGNGIQSLGTSMTKYVTAPILAAGAAALYESDKFEGYARTLRYVTGSAEEGRAVLEKLFKFEGRTPFDVGQLVGATKKLHDIGFSTKSAIKLMESLGDVAAGSGANIEELAYTYGRVAMRGVMTSRELVQFSRMGIPIVEMAKALGMPTQKLAYLAQHGQITAKQMQLAFNRMSGAGGIFHDAMTEKMGTLAVATFKVRDALGQMGGKLGDIVRKAIPIAPTIQAATAFIERMTNRMTAFAEKHPALTKYIIWAAIFAATLGPVIAAVGTLVIGIGAIVAALPSFIAGMSVLATFFTTAVVPALAMSAAILSLANAVRILLKYKEDLKGLFSFEGLKDLYQYVAGTQPAYTGPPALGKGVASPATGPLATPGAAGVPGVAVSQVTNNATFKGQLEIVAPKGIVKKMSSSTAGPGDFDVGMNMAGVGAY